MSLWNLLVKTLLLYIPLLALTDGQKDRQRPNTLAAHGLEELFFQLWFCASFWFWREISFGLHTYVLRVQYSCGVVLVFWLRGEMVFGVTYVLSVQCSCAVVSAFWLWQEIVLKMRTRFYKKKWVTLLWSASRCVYFLRPNTLLLCIFLFCVFLLYRADPQVEVQIRILLKDKYRKSSQNANTGDHTLIS